MEKTIIAETWLAITVLLPQQLLQQLYIQEAFEWYFSCDKGKGTDNAHFCMNPADSGQEKQGKFSLNRTAAI